MMLLCLLAMERVRRGEARQAKPIAACSHSLALFRLHTPQVSHSHRIMRSTTMATMACMAAAAMLALLLSLASPAAAHPFHAHPLANIHVHAIQHKAGQGVRHTLTDSCGGC